MRKKKKVGRLITNDVALESHEYVTIKTLLADGEDVELVRKSRTPHSRSADLLMRSMLWEMKSPNGKTTRCVEHAFRRAIHQAPNVIVDLRRMKIADEILIKVLKYLFNELRSVRILWIVDKHDRILKYKK